MSRAGNYFKTAQAIVNQLAGEKPHSSITDWVEVLSSDRYSTTSLDGIPELVESVNILGPPGTTEASRAIRKKLKYGNSHRQIRALVILRALTENCGHGFKLNWANEQLMERLKMMATDNLLDPKVKKQLILVFHAWSIQYADEPRMREVAGLYGQYSGRRPAGHAKKDSYSAAAPKASTSTPFDDSNDIYSHDWNPTNKGADTYTDLSTARAEAESRKAEREQRMLMERKEAEIERRERELQRKQEMADIEARRRREAEAEAEKRRKAKEDRKKGKLPKATRPRFNFEKEKPAIMQSVATAIQSASSLVNACRLVNRETENVTQNPNVQDKLDKAKAARRTVVRYIQQVTDEEYVGTLLDANEKIVEAIQLYDKLSKPAALDSDSEHEVQAKFDEYDPNEAEPEQVERIRRRLEAQKLEANRTGELQNLQEQQKLESQKMQARALRRNNTGNTGSASTPSGPTPATTNTFQDLQDLDFGAVNPHLPPPMRPDSDEDAYSGGSLSDFSDYDSSDEEYRRGHSRQNSRAQNSRGHSRHNSDFDPYGSSSRHPDPAGYAALEEEGGKQGLLSADDPFGDPFGDDNAARTPQHEKQRMEWAEI